MKLCKEKYKLFLSWEKIEYKNDFEALVIAPKFFGPAIKIAVKIGDNDKIDLDITSQHILLLGYWDIITFSWNKVIKQDTKEAIMDYGMFSSPEMTKVRLFDNYDLLIIDTENHEEKVHANNFVYKTIVAKKDKHPYEYGKK